MAAVFPAHTVTQQYYYSTQCLRQTKQLIKETGSAYLVCGGSGRLEYQIASELQVGLYAGDALLC